MIYSQRSQRKIAQKRMASSLSPCTPARLAGADPEISERGAGSQILERGGPEFDLFSAAFSHFHINLLQIFQQKEGPRPVRPLP